ncbi:hypothetical protein WN51_12316 [Melipona quadrifasciata]|uniref:Uncharacterized protein n=1 Tax=Melipona quadrifasciata TaxID=166423 RepID=A0A0M9A3T7_9HYME|nr:hypothetical protein WN51_12316 [Melipona quadrifasciata]
MARIKKRPHARSHHKMKLRRKPNISELVYKFLSLGGSKEDAREALRNYNITKCQFCKRLKRREEVLDCPNSRPGGSMANKRKDTTRNSKVHRVKRRQTSRDQTLSSCMHKSSGGEGMKKMKRYIQKALDFGVESGYLIPKDAAYKVLRVSSDLMNDANYASRDRRMPGGGEEAEGGAGGGGPGRGEEDEEDRGAGPEEGEEGDRAEEEGSVTRNFIKSLFSIFATSNCQSQALQVAQSFAPEARNLTSSKLINSQNLLKGASDVVIELETGLTREWQSYSPVDNYPNEQRDFRSGAEEEVVDIENEDEYDFGKQGEQRKSPENATRSGENDHLNQSDGEKTAKKRDDDASDLSMDEEETDDEEEKKREDTTKS